VLLQRCVLLHACASLRWTSPFQQPYLG